MVIQHNIPALNAHRLLGVNNANTAKNLEKLSSGYKINRAGDDAAGLAISEKMRGQIRGLGMAEQNAENAISLIQTAEGGMQELHAISQRMREIAVQSTNGTYQDAVDRENLDLEFQQLKEEFDRITDYTNYNGIKLLNGTPYPATAIAATNSTSDLAVGATGVTNIDDTSWTGGTISGIDITLNYNADGTLDLTNITDNSSDFNQGGTAAINADGTLTITLTDSSDGTIELTLDGDWNTGSNVTNIGSIDLKFDVSAAGAAENYNVTTNLRAPKVPASDTAADLAGWAGTVTSVGSGNMTDVLAAGPKTIEITFDADGKIDLTALVSAINTAYGSAIAAGSTTATMNGTELEIEIEDGNTGNTRTITFDGMTGQTSNVEGIQSVSVTLSLAATGGPITAAYGTTTVAAAAGGAGHPDPNYNPGAKNPILFQVGANGTYDQQVELMIHDLHATQLGKETDLSLVTGLDVGYTTFTGWAAQGQTGTTFQIADQGVNPANPQISVQDLHVQDKNAANIAIEVMTTAINELSAFRAELGAVQNRLEYTLNNLGVTKENLTSAESTIRDVDMAKEMTEFTKNNILVQASQAMLAQANALPQGVLNLLR